jgi:hypothetical protein
LENVSSPIINIIDEEVKIENVSSPIINIIDEEVKIDGQYDQCDQ